MVHHACVLLIIKFVLRSNLLWSCSLSSSHRNLLIQHAKFPILHMTCSNSIRNMRALHSPTLLKVNIRCSDVVVQKEQRAHGRWPRALNILYDSIINFWLRRMRHLTLFPAILAEADAEIKTFLWCSSSPKASQYPVSLLFAALKNEKGSATFLLRGSAFELINCSACYFNWKFNWLQPFYCWPLVSRASLLSMWQLEEMCRTSDF